MPAFPSPSGPEDFQAGSSTHAAAVAGCALLMLLFVVAGRRLSAEREERLRRRWVAGVLVVQVVVLTFSFLPGRFDPLHSFPLHLCDLAIFAAALALWTGRRTWRALTYFWAFGLSTQAFLTPTLEQGPARLAFWLFWLVHLQVVGSAVYDVVVGGFRPHGRDFASACFATLAYGAVILPIDVLFGWNYGFIGPADSAGTGTLLEHLPGWPWRPLVMYALGVAVMAVLWLVWPLAGRRAAAAALHERTGRADP